MEDKKMLYEPERRYVRHATDLMHLCPNQDGSWLTRVVEELYQVSLGDSDTEHPDKAKKVRIPAMSCIFIQS